MTERATLGSGRAGMGKDKTMGVLVAFQPPGSAVSWPGHGSIVEQVRFSDRRTLQRVIDSWAACISGNICAWFATVWAEMGRPLSRLASFDSQR